MKRMLAIVFISVWLVSLLPGTGEGSLRLGLEEAGRLARMPLACLGQEFPNKPGETLAAPADIGSPRGLPGYGHLRKIADEHLRHSLPGVVADSYAGGHWLASFAIHALSAAGE